MEVLRQLDQFGLSPEAIAIIVSLIIITHAFKFVIKTMLDSHNASNERFAKAIDRLTEVVDKKWSK